MVLERTRMTELCGLQCGGARQDQRKPRERLWKKTVGCDKL